VLDSERFVDVASATVFATLLMKAVLRLDPHDCTGSLPLPAKSGDRRNQRIYPTYAKPELLAIRPKRGVELGHNQVEGSGEMDLLPSVR